MKTTRIDQVSVVTGAARGIGSAVARMLAEQGSRVALLDLDEQGMQEAATQIESVGGTALSLACDVGRSGAVEAALDRVEQAFGSAGILINSAGIGGPFHRLDEVDEAEWDRIIATNLKSVFLLCRRLLPPMRRSGRGRIVNIASIQGFLGAARSSTYVASKHGMIGYTRAIAAEWGPYGITCNAICPGYVDTRQGPQPAAVPEHLDRILARTPVKRIARPEEIAALVLHLVGPHGGYINGAVLPIDGGISADAGITGDE